MSASARRAARASRSSSVGKRKTLSQRVDEVKAPQGNGTGGLGIREKRALPRPARLQLAAVKVKRNSHLVGVQIHPLSGWWAPLDSDQ